MPTLLQPAAVRWCLHPALPPCHHNHRLARIEPRILASPRNPKFSVLHAPMKLRIAGGHASMDQHADMDMVPSSSSSAHQTRADQLRRALNVSSRWVVVAVVTAVVAWRHDDQVLWAVTGGILNAANSKLLKKVFNQQRPLTALGLKADPGMPSSHAQSLGYFSLYAALGLIFWQGLHILVVAGAATILLCGIYLTWLRISQGLHTPMQVMVGAGFGCSMAGAWIALWHNFVREAVSSLAVCHYLLVCFFGFSAFCFIAFGLRKWRFGDA